MAIPITQVQDKGGERVMPGATEVAIRSMPRFWSGSRCLPRGPYNLRRIIRLIAGLAVGLALISVLLERGYTALFPVELAHG